MTPASIADMTFSSIIPLRKRVMQRFYRLGLVVILFLTFVSVPSAQADWTEYKTSPTDSSNSKIVSPAYDITSVNFAMGQWENNPTDLEYYWFWLNFAQPVKADLFADNSSWAAILIDADNDGDLDYSIQTNSSKSYNGNYYHDGRFLDRRTSSFNEIPSCGAQTWTNLEKSAYWIGFRFKKNCVSLSRTFAIQGYSDRIANDNSDYDYAPESYWAVTPGAPSGSSSSSSSTTSSSNLDRSQLAEFAIASAVQSITTPASAPKDLVALTPKVSPSVVTVLCGDGSGTGWSIDVKLTNSMSNSGYKSLVITNHHVVENCLGSKQVTLVMPSQQRVNGVIWAWSEDDDTAGILTTTQIPVLSWRGATPQQGWWVGVFGSPLGFPGVLTTGIVSSVNATKKTFTTTAPLNPGNSGGPVFDREGRVVGLATAKYRDSEGFGIVHGTPLLCNKILNCLDPNQVWVADLSLIKSSNEDAQLAEAKAKAEAEAKAKAEAEALVKAKAEAEAKAKAEAEERMRLDMKNRCIKFNGDLDLAIFNAKNAGVTYPSSSSIFNGIVNIAPSALDCNYINVATFDSELQNKQRILATLEGSITNGIATAQANAMKKRVTITCVKGKMTKKVTAVSPKCPTGYKKK
jgi:S1-C subfamily serine protease